MKENNRETIGDWLYHAIGDEIVNGSLVANEKISEPQLAKRFGTSRAPIREAIRRLEERGLITRKPHAGTRVVSFSFDQFLELFEIREALESKACRLAANKMTEAELVRLRHILENHEADLSDGPENIYIDQTRDLDFHFQIAQGTKNSALIRLLCEDYYNLLRLCRKRHSWAYTRRIKAHKEHFRILEALEERNGELSELLMRYHINASKSEIKLAFETRIAEKMNESSEPK